MGFLREIFKKGAKADAAISDDNSNKAEISAEEKEAETNLKWRLALNKFNAKRKNELAELKLQKLKEQFPRTVADMVSTRTGKKAVAMDAGIMDKITPNAGLIADDIIFGITDHFIGWQACAILSQNWLINRACCIPAEDAIAPGWDIGFDDDRLDDDFSDDEKAERDAKLKEIKKSYADFKIEDVCRRAEETKKIFGYCLVIPIIEGADMSKPLTEKTALRGKYKGLTVVEPMWVMPEFAMQNYNPVSGSFYEPEYYRIAAAGSFKIHKSWLIKLVNAPVADILKPVYFFGGLPLTQMIYHRVFCAEKVANEAPAVAMTKRTNVVQGDMETAIANPDLFQERINLMEQTRDNHALMIIPTGSEFKQIDTTLTDFDQLIMTQYQLVSSIAQIPVTKLLKIQIRGFDSAGTYEMDDYIQALVAIQQNDYTPIIQLHNRFFTAQTYGEAINLGVNFNLVDVPSAKESAEIRLIDSQRDAVLVGCGAVSPIEVRDKLRNDQDSGYTSIDQNPDSEDFGFEDLDDDGNNDFQKPDVKVEAETNENIEG